MKYARLLNGFGARAILAASLVLAGCSKSKVDVVPTAKTPQEAAAGLDQSFTEAPPATRETVSMISEALRKKEYEKAIVSLHTVQQAPGITLQQGLAIHNSTLLLERELINAIERGDPKAQAAYELLKRSKRN